VIALYYSAIRTLPYAPLASRRRRVRFRLAYTFERFRTLLYAAQKPGQSPAWRLDLLQGSGASILLRTSGELERGAKASLWHRWCTRFDAEYLTLAADRSRPGSGDGSVLARDINLSWDADLAALVRSPPRLVVGSNTPDARRPNLRLTPGADGN
jgi:hypothetical protein